MIGMIFAVAYFMMKFECWPILHDKGRLGIDSM